MEKKGVSFATLVLVAISTGLIVGWAVFFAQQQTYQREQVRLSTQVAELQAQVDSLAAQMQQAQVKPTPTPGRELRSVIQEKGDQVLLALKSQDAAQLAAYVHPQKGLRFTPYTYINTTTDLVFPAAGLPALFANPAPYTWGSYDGSGEPINLAFSAYYGKFVYDKNFLAAPQIAFNQVLQRGNMINNFTTAYPTGVSIEYHYPGFDPQYSGMDWESLKLVFELSGTNWYLVGIIHEQWTI